MRGTRRLLPVILLLLLCGVCMSIAVAWVSRTYSRVPGWSRTAGPVPRHVKQPGARTNPDAPGKKAWMTPRTPSNEGWEARTRDKAHHKAEPVERNGKRVTGSENAEDVKLALKKRVNELVEREYVPRQMLVRFLPNATKKQINAVIGKVNPVQVKRLRTRVDAVQGALYELHVVGTITVANALEILLPEPFVKYAEPNYIAYPAYTPNDPCYSSSGSWGQSYMDLWGLHKIHASKAWDTTKGEGIVVAVIDTGCDLEHPDIAGNLWRNSGEIPGNGQDDDGNGYEDDIFGWDFANNDNDPMDGFGHGTHLSGIVAAIGNNSVGIVGLAFRAKVMALKGWTDSGGYTGSGLTEAVYYAADNGAHVINCSWKIAESQALHDAVKYAHDSKDCVIVAATGNDNGSADSWFPAAWPESIAVAASGPNDERTVFSNYGNCVDVAAPGWDILSLWPNAQYAVDHGTSMAAPYVSALAALILAKSPGCGPEAVREVVRATAVDICDPGFDIYSGYGRIDAGAALSFLATDAAEITSPAQDETVSGTVTVKGTATASDFSGWMLELGAGTAPDSWQQLAAGAQPVRNSDLSAWDTTSVVDGFWTLRLTVDSATPGQFIDAVSLVARNTTISKVPIVTVNSVSPTVVNPTQSATVNWISDKNGVYHVEVGGTGEIGSGTQIAGGDCTAFVPVDTLVLENHIPDDKVETIWVIVNAGAGGVGCDSALVRDNSTAMAIPSKNSKSGGCALTDESSVLSLPSSMLPFLLLLASLLVLRRHHSQVLKSEV